MGAMGAGVVPVPGVASVPLPGAGMGMPGVQGGMGMGGMGMGMGGGGMFVNPMMMQMMMGMGMMNPMMMGAPGEVASVSSESRGTGSIEPRIKQLCREYSIDEQTCLKLHEAMMSREDYDEDVQALHMVMQRETGEKGKKPLEAMLTQIRALKTGRFPGKWLLDKDVWDFVTKYNLDGRVLHKLIQTLNERKLTKKQDIKALDERLSSAQELKGLGLLMRLLEGLCETGRLPSPPRRLGGSGTFHPTGTFLHPADRKGREGRERRRRSRSQSRSRSRGRR